MKMEPQNRLAEIFHAMGIDNFRPSAHLLDRWGMSISRFNQLRNNEGRLNIQVQEERVLREWMRENLAPKHHYLFADEIPVGQRGGKQEELQLR